MPTLARFYGIIMRMYFLGSEHNPPHVHAIYGEDTAAFDIRTGEMIEGGMPSRGNDTRVDLEEPRRAPGDVGDAGVQEARSARLRRLKCCSTR